MQSVGEDKFSEPETLLMNGPPSSENKEDFEISKTELEQIKLALKNEKFRNMLSDYVEEIRNPENQRQYQSEMTQLERERGNIVHFVNPVAGYVLKSSSNGDKKIFINMCSNPLIIAPTFEEGTENKRSGYFWRLPYIHGCHKEDIDKSGRKCMVYDVIFNPKAFEMARHNSALKQKLEETAIEAIGNRYSITLDIINIRYPRLRYKGLRSPSVFRYKHGEQPPELLDRSQIGMEPPPEMDNQESPHKWNQSQNKKIPRKTQNLDGNKLETTNVADTDYKLLKHSHPHYSSWTIPKYSFKYRSNIDLQDYCNYQQPQSCDSTTPSEIVLIIDLPLLRDSSTIEADVTDTGTRFELKSDRKALYYLTIPLPYTVIDESAKATFDTDLRKLTVMMKTIKKKAN